MKLTFEIASDLYVAGRDEEGQDYTAEVYFIRAENERGDCWRHGHVFPGCRVVDYSKDPDYDGWGHYLGFQDIREEAMADAEKLLARIHAAGGKVNLDHWREDRAAYGSRAYIEYGQHEEWMEEQRERCGV